MNFNSGKYELPAIGVGVLAIINTGKHRYMTIAEYRGSEWLDRVSFDGYTNPHIIPLQHVEAWTVQMSVLDEYDKQK